MLMQNFCFKLSTMANPVPLALLSAIGCGLSVVVSLSPGASGSSFLLRLLCFLNSAFALRPAIWHQLPPPMVWHARWFAHCSHPSELGRSGPSSVSVPYRMDVVVGSKTDNVFRGQESASGHLVSTHCRCYCNRGPEEQLANSVERPEEREAEINRQFIQQVANSEADAGVARYGKPLAQCSRADHVWLAF